MKIFEICVLKNMLNVSRRSAYFVDFSPSLMVNYLHCCWLLLNYLFRRMVDKCMDYYVQLIRMFKPNVHRIILSSIITFYKDGKLWDIEFACTDMIVALLDIYPEVEDGVNDLLSKYMMHFFKSYIYNKCRLVFFLLYLFGQVSDLCK